MAILLYKVVYLQVGSERNPGGPSTWLRRGPLRSPVCQPATATESKENRPCNKVNPHHPFLGIAGLDTNLKHLDASGYHKLVNKVLDKQINIYGCPNQ